MNQFLPLLQNLFQSLVPGSLKVSQKLPGTGQLSKEIADLQAKLSGVKGGFMGDLVRRSLQDQIQQKQTLLRSITNPSSAAGVPPAPDAPAILGPRIEPPKVGVNDLKIMLPTR